MIDPRIKIKLNEFYARGEETNAKVNANAAVKMLKEEKNHDGTFAYSRDSIPDERYVRGYYSYLTRKKKMEGIARTRGKIIPVDIDQEIENGDGDRNLDIINNINEMDETDILQEHVRPLKKRAQRANT